MTIFIILSPPLSDDSTRQADFPSASPMETGFPVVEIYPIVCDLSNESKPKSLFVGHLFSRSTQERIALFFSGMARHNDDETKRRKLASEARTSR